MKGIYLAAGNAFHPNYDIDYQDLIIKRDIGGDMLEIDLKDYDYIIATPPCNFWSRARGNKVSDYALETKHLLPDILNKLIKLGKPFIVENVKNDKRMLENNILPRYDCFIYYINRHIYFTNVKLDISNIEQRQDFKYGGKVIKYDDMNNQYHQGGFNVYNVIERFLLTIKELELIKKSITKESKATIEGKIIKLAISSSYGMINKEREEKENER